MLDVPYYLGMYPYTNVAMPRLWANVFIAEYKCSKTITLGYISIYTDSRGWWRCAPVAVDDTTTNRS